MLDYELLSTVDKSLYTKMPLDLVKLIVSYTAPPKEAVMEELIKRQKKKANFIVPSFMVHRLLSIIQSIDYEEHERDKLKLIETVFNYVCDFQYLFLNNQCFPIIKSTIVDFYALKNMTNLTYIYRLLTGEYIQL